MASNSTPRLKAYRLPQNNYSDTGDNDIQTKTDDEMLPVVVKNLNPLSAEEMRGVRMRQDGRVVVADSDSEFSFIPLVAVMNSNGVITTKPVCCEGWVLGKGNIELFVYRQKRSDDVDELPVDPTYSAAGDAATYSYPSTGTGEWTQVDRRFWDYDVEGVKTYLVSSGEAEEEEADANRLFSYSDFSGRTYDWEGRVSTTIPSTAEYEIHSMDWITFRLGNMLFNSTRFFVPSGSGQSSSAGYAEYVPVAQNSNGSESKYAGYILVAYRRYSEPSSAFDTGNFGGDTPSVRTSQYCVPFGNIYNGNKNGRCLNVKIKDTGGNPHKTHVIEDASYVVDESRMNYYEGNYLFKRRIYPFRVKVLKHQDDTHTDFVADQWLVNGRAVVPCELSWFMDDIMKPVVFERIWASESRYIFKQLTRQQVVVQYQNTTQNGNHYVITLNQSYYNSTNYPKELFLAYNYVDDSLGNIFDFDYDYFDADFSTRSALVGYGYANNGCFTGYKGADLTGRSDPSYVYLKRSILAVKESEGRDPARDLLLKEAPGGVSFTMAMEGSSSSSDSSSSASDEEIELNRIIGGLAFFDPEAKVELYVDGKVIYCSKDNPIVTGYTVAWSGNDCTITGTNDGTNDGIDASSLTEVLVVYYEKHEIAFSATGNINPYCIGYRIPCYEKVKTATLFVSSYPNWLKGHVNNDLDVFYGNQLYSGTAISGESLSNYHDIYPSYVKDGWYAMYSEGAVEFNEEKTEIDYFDIVNFVSLGNGTDLTAAWAALSQTSYSCPDYWIDAGRLMLNYQKVRYNVAHIDGIYSVMRGRLTNYTHRNGEYKYALIADDEQALMYDKQWVRRSDSEIRRMIESGRDTLPAIVSGNGMEASPVLTNLNDIVLADGQYATINTADDRVALFFVPSGATATFCFRNNPTAAGIIEGAAASSYVQVQAVVDASSNCLKLGVASGGSVTDWVFIPDLPDICLGGLSSDGESWKGNGIDSFQSNEITADGVAMECWDETATPATRTALVDGRVPDSMLNGSSQKIRFRYRDAAWGYDVFFEVLSYRYNDTDANPYLGPGETLPTGVEVVAYREMKQ